MVLMLLEVSIHVIQVERVHFLSKILDRRVGNERILSLVLVNSSGEEIGRRLRFAHGDQLSSCGINLNSLGVVIVIHIARSLLIKFSSGDRVHLEATGKGNSGLLGDLGVLLVLVRVILRLGFSSVE